MRGILVLLSLLMVFWVNFSSARSEEVTCLVDFDVTHQRIDGFGGSIAFHKAGSVMRLPEPVRSQILDLVFSRERGIGLSIVRVVVGDGGSNEWGDPHYDGPAETIEPQPGKFVWDDPNWDEDSFDRYQIWGMREAKKRGIETFLATVWSPPAWMKTNNSVIGGKLKRECYQDFAEYLASYVQGYREHFGIEITHVSPANEPNLETRYSSCLWTPWELNEFVRDYLGPTFKKRNVQAKIVLGEDSSFREDYVAAALLDEKTVEYVDVVAAHAYGIERQRGVPDFPISKSKGKVVWQTEYMNGERYMQNSYRYNTIDDAIRHALLIADMLTIPNVSAYLWWWPVSNSGADGSNLIRLCNEGNRQSERPTENGLFRVFKRFYAFGNYSRFVRPGYVRVHAEKHPVDGVTVTAFKDPKSGSFVVVAVNDKPSSRRVTFELRNVPKEVEAVVPYRTSASENLKKLPDVPVVGGLFTVELRGRSVTTFVSKDAELPPLPDMKDVFSTFEAEENDGMSETLKVAVVEGRTVVTNVSDGAFIRYRNVNFADGTASGDKPHVLSMSAVVRPKSGGVVEVRLDDPRTGKLVGTMKIEPSSSPVWKEVSTLIDTNRVDGAWGFHDLYLVFKGEGDMFDVDRFEFGDGG